jgi:hypothetical protein
MPYIIYSLVHGTPVAKVDAALQDVTLRDGEVAIPCLDSDSPDDPKWPDEAAQYDAKYALTNAQVLQAAAVSSACQASIYAGFTSSALGGPYHYPCDDQDQTNLNGCVLASTLPIIPADWTTKFWCADASGGWDMRSHTAAQIQQVGLDGLSAKETAVQKNKDLAAQIVAATTLEAVQAIAWG